MRHCAVQTRSIMRPEYGEVRGRELQKFQYNDVDEKMLEIYLLYRKEMKKGNSPLPHESL